MDRHATRSVDIPKWSALLVEAVNKPGLIMKAYTPVMAQWDADRALAALDIKRIADDLTRRQRSFRPELVRA